MAAPEKGINSIMRGMKKDIGKTRPVVMFGFPFQTLISTVLSARTKDNTTAAASKRLFREFESVEKLAKANTKRIEKLIFPAGFYKTKAKRIITISRILSKDYDSRVPKTLEELTSLPGVGRKTANLVLALSFHIPAIAVDTHVHRVSNRIGLVKTRSPEETEKALMKIFPKKQWIGLNELLVKFGQKRCTPTKPRCSGCPIFAMCDYFRQNAEKSKT